MREMRERECSWLEEVNIIKRRNETKKSQKPKDHQSTAFPCPLFSKISGAKYSGVPQNV